MNVWTTETNLEGLRPATHPKPQKPTFTAERKSLSHHDYTVGWVCALPLELGAATAMLDEEHQTLPVGPGDKNTYTLGRMEHHNIVLVCLPSYGTAKAATVASHMLRSFPNIQAGLMVGIGGGVPTGDADIRLGDVVVGNSVVQYDLGKTVRGGKFERTDGSGKSPPDNLKMAVQSLHGRHNLQPTRIPDILSEMLERHPSTRKVYNRPLVVLDRLFEAAYDHVKEPNDGNAISCDHCDISRLVQRPERTGQHGKIHYGKIASGNQVIKHGKTRDRLAHELGAVCFEMEAAGLVDANFPCLVVRGISDYADSHKNYLWQGYAAAVAAAYAKELLAILPASQNPFSVTGQEYLQFSVCQRLSLGKNVSPENPEAGSVVSEFPAQSYLSSAVETLERLGNNIQVSTKDIKAVARTFRHDATRMALKIRRAEQMFLRVNRPIQSGARFERRAHLKHSEALKKSSTVASLARSLQKLNCGEFQAEFKLEVPVLSCTGSPFSSSELVPRRDATEGLSVIYSTVGVSTDPVKPYAALQSETGMEGIVWGKCSWREELDQSFDGCLATEILTPSAFDFIEERGHTYSSYGTREYMLPCDDSWILAEELLHCVLHDLVLEKKLLLGSVTNFEGRVLDVGTGIGMWAMDMADDNPRADVIGVDISPIQPEWVPPNCRFIIDDLALSYGLVFASSDYCPNVIHCGNMTMAIYDWTRFVAWIKRELQPEGSVEFQELLWCPCVEQGGTIIPDTGPLAGFFLTLAEAFSAVGINLDAPRHLWAELELSGFKHVSQQDFLVPLGNWPRDPRQKKIGAGFYKFLMQAIEPLSNRVLRRGLNYRPGKAKLWARQFKETLEKSRGEMILFKFIVVHGRKSRAV